MPSDAFKVVQPSFQNLLGGRNVKLTNYTEIRENDELGVSNKFTLGKKEFSLEISKNGINLTGLEKKLIQHFIDSFKVLFNRFEPSGYRAHLRTAINASVLDITIARLLRGDNKKAYNSLQNIIQILKSLSFERYEGSPATTGFLIYKYEHKDIPKSFCSFRDAEIDKITTQKIDNDFFSSPLTYRYIDGISYLYVSDIKCYCIATVRINNYHQGNTIDKLSNFHFDNLLKEVKGNAFGAFLNNSSEIEIVLPERKVIVWRRGTWSVFDPDIFYSFFDKGLEIEIIDELIWAVYSLSKIRHGTLILVSDMSEDVVKKLKKGSVAGSHTLSNELIKKVKDKPIKQLKENNQLIRILSSDGMTVINTGGRLVDTGVITDLAKIRTNQATGGGRTTAAIAASHYGKVIKVSEDGPIDLYEKGEKIYRFG